MNSVICGDCVAFFDQSTNYSNEIYSPNLICFGMSYNCASGFRCPACFDNYSVNFGNVCANACFVYSINSGYVMYEGRFCYSENCGYVCGNSWFYSSTNCGHLSMDSWFDSSTNCGTLSACANLNNSSNCGYICQDAAFSGSSCQIDGGVCGCLILRDISVMCGGSVGHLILCDQSTYKAGSYDCFCLLVNYTTPTNVYSPSECCQYFTYDCGFSTLATGAWSSLYLGGHYPTRWNAGGFPFSPVWTRSGVCSDLPYTFQAQDNNCWYIYINTEYPTPDYNGTLASDYYINAAINNGQLCTNTDAFVKKVFACNYVAEDFYKSYTSGIADELPLNGFYLKNDYDLVYLNGDLNINTPDCSFIYLIENSCRIHGCEMYQYYCSYDGTIHNINGHSSAGYFVTVGCFNYCNPFSFISSASDASYFDINYQSSSAHQAFDNNLYYTYCNGSAYLASGAYHNYYITDGNISDCTTYTPVTTLDSNECRFYISGQACDPSCFDKIFDDNHYYHSTFGAINGQHVINKYFSDDTKIGFININGRNLHCPSIYDPGLTPNSLRGFTDGVKAFYATIDNTEVIGIICSDDIKYPIITESKLSTSTYQCNYWIYCCGIGVSIATGVYSNGFFNGGDCVDISNYTGMAPVIPIDIGNDCYKVYCNSATDYFGIAVGYYSNGCFNNGIKDCNVSEECHIAVDKGVRYYYCGSLVCEDPSKNGFYCDYIYVDDQPQYNRCIVNGTRTYADVFITNNPAIIDVPCSIGWIYKQDGVGTNPNCYGYNNANGNIQLYLYHDQSCTCANCYCTYNNTSWNCYFDRLCYGITFINGVYHGTLGYPDATNTFVFTSCYYESYCYCVTDCDEYGNACGWHYGCDDQYYCTCVWFCFANGAPNGGQYCYWQYCNGVQCSAYGTSFAGTDVAFMNNLSCFATITCI